MMKTKNIHERKLINGIILGSYFLGNFPGMMVSLRASAPRFPRLQDFFGSAPGNDSEDGSAEELCRLIRDIVSRVNMRPASYRALEVRVFTLIRQSENIEAARRLLSDNPRAVETLDDLVRIAMRDSSGPALLPWLTMADFSALPPMRSGMGPQGQPEFTPPQLPPLIDLQYPPTGGPRIKENLGNKNGDTLLHRAVRSNRSDIVRVLLKHSRTDKNQRNQENKSPLDLALDAKNEEIIRMLSRK
jgi:hypothetical protein